MRLVSVSDASGTDLSVRCYKTEGAMPGCTELNKRRYDLQAIRNVLRAEGWEEADVVYAVIKSMGEGVFSINDDALTIEFMDFDSLPEV